MRLKTYLLNSAGVTTSVVTGRVDYSWPRWGLMAGGSVSGRPVEVSPTVAGLLWSDRVWFGGGSIHVGARTVVVTYENTRQGGVTGMAIRCGVVLPLGK